MYIHDALSEYITCGDTSMTTKSLKFTMEDLAKVTEHKSGYEKQLEVDQQLHVPLAYVVTCFSDVLDFTYYCIS